jgi:DMSO/TMAO reductase YedYZ molybdopterin-dependent catalytic subunit
MPNLHNVDRRELLGGVAVAALPFLASRSVAADIPSSSPASSGLIIREKQPVNLEFPFPHLNGVKTPTNLFFVRTHFPIPAVEAATWTLTVDGAVNQELSLSSDELRKLPAKTVPVLLECAGNGRAHLVPKAKGLLWESGAVGTAHWTGVPLSVVLEKAGVKKGAVDVVLQGADSGEITEEPKSPGIIHFERSLPLAKAMKPEVLLAYQMNGKDLTKEHGFPVRAIVGGWYGMASVKWLTRITVSATRFEGFWQSLEYAYWQRDKGRPTLTPVTEIQVKAQIARPALSEAVPAGKSYRVFGAAWTGETDVAKVEFSSNEGKTWAEAKLLGEAVPFAWRLWEFTWDVPKVAGRYKLTARATDGKGRTQPEKHDKDRRNYMINFTARVEVEVG